MSAVLLDGKALAAKTKQNVRENCARLTRPPCLAVILVGDNPASAIYVKNKEKDCVECGIACRDYRLPAETSQAELLMRIHALNQDAAVDGILVQLPLPAHIQEQEIIASIAPDKDVDGFHPINVGRLAQGSGKNLPCTPAGILALLREYNISPTGKHCVMVGRSNIVGRPMSLLMLQADATVTICHTKTADLKAECLQADILISAAGHRGLITADMVKPGAVVVDVAMNRREDGKLCGDADFDALLDKVSYITPVPGGVGPMTRAMLMENTYLAAERHCRAEK